MAILLEYTSNVDQPILTQGKTKNFNSVVWPIFGNISRGYIEKDSNLWIPLKA